MNRARTVLTMNLSYFWYTWHDLPDDVGFSYFDGSHLSALAMIAAGISLCAVIFLRLSMTARDRLLRTIAALIALGEIARDIYLLAAGRMGMEYLPLHLCSLSIVVYLLHAFLRPCRLRDALGEISWCLLMPGSICALLFPNWTAYPMLNFMNLHSFIWHALLVLYPVLLLCGGRIHPALRHWWYPVVFLLIVTPPVYLFDRVTGYNYMFVLYPLPGTPLMWFYELLGPWWRLGYALGILGIILLVLSATEIWQRMKKGKITNTNKR